MFARILNQCDQTVILEKNSWYYKIICLTLFTLLSDKFNFKLDSAYDIFATTN